MRTLIGCLAAYIIILFRHGYVFGSGDQSEMLPYAKFLINNGLYAKDFYIRSIAVHVPNERLAFSWLLSKFGNGMEIAAFVLHFLTTIFLILGLHRLVKKWTTTEGGAWIATLAPILVLYGVNLGGNELYYNSLVPSYLAQACGIWMLCFIMEGRLEWAYPFVFLATAIHPLIGVQLWILMVAMNLSFEIWLIYDHAFRNFLILNALYLATMGYYVFAIKQGFDGGSVSSNAFLDIMEFRAAHHYFPNYFPISSWLILLPLIALFTILAKKHLKQFVGIIALGCLVYTIGVYILRHPTPLSMQWFSTTVWLKTFAMMTVIGLLEDYFVESDLGQRFAGKPLIFNGLITSALAVSIFILPQFSPFKNKSYDLPFWKNNSPEVEISRMAKDKTPTDALFLIPSDLSTFRFWSERSSYIDYKATNHRQTAFAEWYNRIQEVYKINLTNRREKSDLPFVANNNFQTLREQDFLKLVESKGISHVLTFKNHVLAFPKLGENERFVIYKIEKGPPQYFQF